MVNNYTPQWHRTGMKVLVGGRMLRGREQASVLTGERHPSLHLGFHDSRVKRAPFCRVFISRKSHCAHKRLNSLFPKNYLVYCYGHVPVIYMMESGRVCYGYVRM